jgi:FKBP-type peptidyl-prolyl cis-trans isomerase
MMKKPAIAVLLSLLIFSCSEKKGETTASQHDGEQKYISPFTDAEKIISVKDLTLQSKQDTVSYALGIAWAHGLGRVGINQVSYAFYLGVHDYMAKNKSFVNTTTAATRIDHDVELLKSDSTHPMDPDQKLGEISLSSTFDTLSYVWAYSWTPAVKEIGIEKLSPPLMLGLTRGLAGDNSMFSYVTADKYLRSYVDDLLKAKFAGIKSQNENWLAENKTKKDVVTLPSGVQYKIIKNGNGKSPAANDVIVCHYTGKLIDGTQFESTYDEGTPLQTYPSGVIAGWREALPKMKVGSLWELYVPYQSGYGSGGTKGKIPPFSTLIYQIELIDVKSSL